MELGFVASTLDPRDTPSPWDSHTDRPANICFACPYSIPRSVLLWLLMPLASTEVPTPEPWYLVLETY